VKETSCTVRARSQTGYQRACTPSLEASHCNESWLLLKYELAMTSWLSPKDMDTEDWWRNNNQLETDVAERRGAWTSWRVVAMDYSCLWVMMMMMMICAYVWEFLRKGASIFKRLSISVYACVHYH